MITKNVSNNSLSLTRSNQIEKKNYKRKKKVMCGIIGIASNKSVTSNIINSLKDLNIEVTTLLEWQLYTTTL